MRITLDNLKRTYSAGGGAISAVNGIGMEIPSNTIYGIIGKSGAGKSTLVRLISLLEKPDSGEIYYDGVRVDNLAKKELIERRRRIGMIFQNFNLFSSRNAEENIAYPMEIAGTAKPAIRARTGELLSLVGLEGRGKAPISTLSGGQKQRVAIARALANNPDILFCDEATSALDPQTTHSILNLIRDLQHRMNLTVVMITHQMEVVRDTCELVTVLDDGRPVEQGTVADIFTAPRSPVTRDFLAHLAPMEGPPAEELPVEGHPKDGAEKIVRWSSEGGHYILHFRGNKTGEPILSRLSRLFDIEFNIRAGGIQRTALQDVGTLITDITGDREEVEKALRWLKEQDIIVEEVNP
ncbi:MAG: ATP-binding cassette domain-containing protein [Spirochaetaceae bacterium]|jgi:D-methionine transport system ATP-binding protein|nr:ATP-binding cassette domain-containing protein [Spirochaetaceae bacterium]